MIERIKRASALWVLTAVAVAILLVSVACGSEKVQEPYRDAVTAPERNSDPARIIEMPDGFSNLAGKCDGSNYVYVVYHGDSPYGSVAVVPNDSRCTG